MKSGVLTTLKFNILLMMLFSSFAFIHFLPDPKINKYMIYNIHYIRACTNMLQL